MRGKEEHLTLADRDVPRPAVLPDPQHHVSLQLVEELVAGIVVEVRPLVRTADDGHDEVPVLPHLGVADGRAQHLAVVLDPTGQVDGLHVNLLPPPGGGPSP
jgi:hypothetical protein